MRCSLVSLAFAALVLVACAPSSVVSPGQIGDPCSPSRGCADGLTCHDQLCADPTPDEDLTSSVTIDATAATITDGSAPLPDGSAVLPDGSVALPDGSTTTPDSAVVAADASVRIDATVIAPDATVPPDATIATDLADPCANVACFSPPPNSCTNTSTLRAYGTIGTCAAGQCAYSPSLVPCASGCSNGACNPSGWQTMVSNTNQRLLGVWGSSASAVWAVGEGGTTVYYNGVQWQVRPLPSAAAGRYMAAVHGTATDNVFTAGSHMILRFDGTQWNVVVDLYGKTGCNINSGVSGLFATGNSSNDVFVTCGKYISTTGASRVLLYRVSGAGAIALLADVPGDILSTGSAGGVWALSGTEVWMAGQMVNHWDGAVATVVGGTTGSISAGRLWGTSPSAMFGVYNCNDGAKNDLRRWNGTRWDVLGTGLAGQVTSVSGTSPQRVFLSGVDNSSKGVVLFYDGIGFTQQTLPGGVGKLEAVWAASTGEVFAVGQAGVIVKGP